MSDFTVASREGTVYVSFLQDVLSRRSMGFMVASSMSTLLTSRVPDKPSASGGAPASASAGRASSSTAMPAVNAPA